MSTRERLIETAADLFYAQGIHSSGIDAVVARSGFSKPTLYRYFRSKEELITAVLEMRAGNRKAALEKVAVDAKAASRDPLGAVIDYFVSWYADEDYRGCALVNGAVELPDPSHQGREVVRLHKEWMTGFLEGLAEAADLGEPRRLAESLVMLEEGATVMAYVGTEGSVGMQLRHAAKGLMASHVR
jgi:AcrR family transcriptional regulator